MVQLTKKFFNFITVNTSRCDITFVEFSLLDRILAGMRTLSILHNSHMQYTFNCMVEIEL